MQRKVVKLGKERAEIEVCDDFQLYFICIEQTPKLAPNVFAKTQVINFTLSK
jgi:hypothetical protein